MPAVSHTATLPIYFGQLLPATWNLCAVGGHSSHFHYPISFRLLRLSMVLPSLDRFRHFATLCAIAALTTSSSNASSSSSSSSLSSSSSSSGAVVGASTNDDLTWADCGTFTNSVIGADFTTQCAKYSAPLCHVGICEDSQNRKVDVNIKRVKSATQDPENSPNVWFLQGGAGTDSSAFKEAMTTLHAKLNGKVNVYTMDQRGTGESTAIDCLSVMNHGVIEPMPVAECAQALERKYGSDLSAFSITSAATDVSTFISKYQANSKTFVYGAGYGTVLAERLMHLNATEIIGYVLDAVKTTSGSEESEFLYESTSATDFGQVADGLVDVCRDAACKGKFAAESLRDLLTRMTTNYGDGLFSKCSGIVSTENDRQQSFAVIFKSILADMFMNEQAVGLIAAFVYRFNRCNDEDFKVISRFLYHVLPTLKDPFDESAYTSSLVYKLITFSEMWETPTPTVETMMQRNGNASMSKGPMASYVSTYCEFTKENSTACAVQNITSYPSAPIAYARDKYWNKAARIPEQASVLVICSAPDAQAPQKYAERLFKALDGTNKAFFNPKYMSHGSLWWSPQNTVHQESTPSGMSTLVAYVQNNADLSKLNIAYGVGGIPSFTVITSEYVSAQLFGVKDAFEGKLPDDMDTISDREDDSAKTACIVVVIAVAVLVLAGAVVFLYRRHVRAERTKQQQEQELSDDVLKEYTRETVSPSGSISYNLGVPESRV